MPAATLSIESWIENIISEQVSKPFETEHPFLASPPPSVSSSPEGRLRKKKRTWDSCPTASEMGDSHPPKRTRTGAEVGDTTSVVLSERTESTIFQPTPSQIVSAASRSSSPTRDLLNEMRLGKPTVMNVELSEIEPPPKAVNVFNYLADGFGKKYIPLELKVRR